VLCTHAPTPLYTLDSLSSSIANSVYLSAQAWLQSNCPPAKHLTATQQHALEQQPIRPHRLCSNPWMQLQHLQCFTHSLQGLHLTQPTTRPSPCHPSTATTTHHSLCKCRGPLLLQMVPLLRAQGQLVGGHSLGAPSPTWRLLAGPSPSLGVILSQPSRHQQQWEWLLQHQLRNGAAKAPRCWRPMPHSGWARGPGGGSSIAWAGDADHDLWASRQVPNAADSSAKLPSGYLVLWFMRVVDPQDPGCSPSHIGCLGSPAWLMSCAG
jgi:hypothetical protein